MRGSSIARDDPRLPPLRTRERLAPAMLFPATTPPWLPARRCFSTPRSPCRKRPPVVLHGPAEQRRRNVFGRERDPGTVVARALVPDAVGEQVVRPVVEEVVGVHVRRVRDRASRNRH